jgi:6,7-dimethyl-8-ribityllumazine synthase
VQGLATHCSDELRKLSPASSVTLHRVPGAFEIPIVVRERARLGNVDAIVALGVILQGETEHAQHLGQVVTQALQQISLEHGVPVIHAVLSLKNEQARKRCLEDEINRAPRRRTAVEMANLPRNCASSMGNVTPYNSAQYHFWRTARWVTNRGTGPMSGKNNVQLFARPLIEDARASPRN